MEAGVAHLEVGRHLGGLVDSVEVDRRLRHVRGDLKSVRVMHTPITSSGITYVDVRHHGLVPRHKGALRQLLFLPGEWRAVHLACMESS